MGSLLRAWHKTSNAKGLVYGFESNEHSKFKILRPSVAWSLPKVPVCWLSVGANFSVQNLQDNKGCQLSWQKTLDHLEQPGTCANVATYAALLQECRNSQGLSVGQCIHVLIAKSQHGQSTYLSTHLVLMYGQFGALEDAYALFKQMLQKSVYAWNAMIGMKAHQGQWEEVFGLFEQMSVEGALPDAVSFVTSLSGCNCQRALNQGKRIHACIAGSEFEVNVVVRTALINMYGKCEHMEDAQSMFDEMLMRDTVIWNAMIGMYAQQGRNKEALELFFHMCEEGLMPNRVSFLGILDACGNHANLAIGKQIHVNLRHAGFDSDGVMATSLLSMYGKCDSLQNAKLIFETMPAQSVVSMNAMIALYAQHQQCIESLKLFARMQQGGIIPDNITFRTILSACTSRSTIPEAKYLHTCIICSGCESDILVATSLLSAYGKSGCLADAQKLFARLHKKDVVSWNAMISVYAQTGHGKAALQLFNQMQKVGMVPDKVTFISSLLACAESSLEDAHKLFQSLSDCDVVVWNVMITAYVKWGFGKKAIILFEQMLWEGLIPDKATFLTILSACGSHKALIDGRRVHIQIIHNGYGSDVELLTAAIHMYSKCGNLEEAYCVFEQMHKRDVILWNAMISAYSQHGHGKRALHLFDQMQQDGVIPDNFTFADIFEACASEAALVKGKHIHSFFTQSESRSDAVVATALVNMYQRCSSMQDARSAFNQIQEHDVVSCTAMIAAYTEQGEDMEAFILFTEIQREGIIPDRAIYISLLGACIRKAALMEGKILHIGITNHDLKPDVVLANVLVNMYGKCGSMEDAERLFDRMTERDVLSFNTMVTGYAQHGHGKKALQLLAKMHQGKLSPDQVTFASILYACNHAGLVDEGRLCLECMEADHSITLTGEHYDCIVDLLGRSGRLEEAEELINKMPVQPNYVSWMTFLGACRNQTNFESGECIAWHLFELDLEPASPYVMLSNLSSACNRADDAKQILTIMRSQCFSQRLAHTNQGEQMQVNWR